MLDKLRRYLESLDLDFVRLDSLALDGQDATLVLRILNYEDGTWSIWEVRALGLRDFCLKEPYYGALTVHSDHVLARQHTDSRVELYFYRKPPSTAELVGQLYVSHDRLVTGWIPFRRYLNNQVELEALIGGGYGKLADGPEFLIAAYTTVLEANGVSPSLLPPRAAKWAHEGTWIEMEAHLSTLIIGDSFFVAVAFEERLA